AFEVAGPQACHFAALSVEISTQLARYVDCSSSSPVIPDVHHVIFDPHVVSAFFGNVVLRDFLGSKYIRHINHVNNTLRRYAGLVGQIELGREDLVAKEDVILVAENRMCTGEPARTVEFGVIESKLTHELRMFRRAALDAFADVQDHEPVFP